MSDGVIVTAILSLKPETLHDFLRKIHGMMENAKVHKGYRNIRLLPSDSDPCQFILIEEWDEANDFAEYMVAHNEHGEVDDFLAASISPPQIAIWKGQALAG